MLPVPYTISNPTPDREEIAKRLEDAGWLSVADDVRDGVSAETIEARLYSLGYEADVDEPIDIINNAQASSLTKAHHDDAAYDLRATEDTYLLPNERRLISTSLRVAIPEGYAGLVLPRSGLALKHGVTVLNAPGLIDPGYRGDVGVILWNTAHSAFHVSPGDRIAQLLFVKTAELNPAWVSSDNFAQYDDSDRGEGGFGSTGR